MIFSEPPGVLQEVGIALNKIIPGCNSAKKLTFGKKKLQLSPSKISVHLILSISGGFRKF